MVSSTGYSCSRSTVSTNTSNTLHSTIDAPTQSCNYSPPTLLATSLALVVTPTHTHQVRLLIDPGSELTLVSDTLINLLKLPRTNSSFSILGVGTTHAGRTLGVATLTLKSLHSYNSVRVLAHILRKLTGQLPSVDLSSAPLDQYQQLQLADPEFTTPRPVDIILGADAYGLLIKPDVLKYSPGMPIAQRTIFGWVILGPVHTAPKYSQQVHHVTLNQEENELQELLTRFWVEQELPHSTKHALNSDEEACEAHFIATHTRDREGRYIVRLPLTASPTQLGNSYNAAYCCLKSQLNRLSKDETFKQLYETFMEEYETLGHMKKVKSTPIESNLHSGSVEGGSTDGMTLAHEASASGGLRVPEGELTNPYRTTGLNFSTQTQYYLPHHGVLKDSTTTKLRVVFNGSKKTTSGLSLNDLLHTGAKLQEDIVNVLLWVRRHRFIFATDITKMFRQILVDQRDWDLQRILWVDERHKITPYQLTTVTYGTRSAPFLAVRVLLQLVEDEGAKYPLAIRPLTQGRYVDDIFGGADSIQNLQDTATQVTALCKAGGFPLAKWNSNASQLLQLNQSEAKDTPHEFNTDSDSSTKVLGLHWSPKSDQFFFTLSPPTQTQKYTKRLMLSEVAQLFDPLGLLSPLIIRAKVLLQELWLIKLGWDDPLPATISKKWANFKLELKEIPKIRIPRWIKLTTNSTLEIHGFSDSSQRAMAAAVYLKVQSHTQGTHVTLVCSKTKVAPIKPLTIPRLELSAAVLLAKLTKFCQQNLELESVPVYLWTDSSVTLTWLHSHPSRWKDFVRNRVSLIQELIPHGHWKFIPGKENPADCATRGLTPNQLNTHKLWWTGPPWLLQNSESWPTHKFKLESSVSLEERPGVSFFTTQLAHLETWDLIERYSSINKLCRITAICFRVQLVLKRVPNSTLTTPLTPDELLKALECWVKIIQAQYFAAELKLLNSGAPWPNGHNFARLTAYVDTHGIIRVGGRLAHSSLLPAAKHPAILPRKSTLTQLIIADSHERTLHGGTQITLTHIRQQFWIIGGRQPVRSYILKCMKCARWRAQRAQQLMGQLPASRVTPSPPFTQTGVDYAGPITLKTWKGRGAKSSKGWLCVFVCFSTSAVHLEAVSDYSTDGFIAAFRRFSGRRGICHTLHSDCGTNFLGADRELKQLFTQGTQEFSKLHTRFAQDRITWKFNPPAAPHMGGKWEAVVKSVKTHLNRTIGDTALTYEEFTTLLVQVEAVLNSRPLEPLTEDPEDLEALTPGHFLIGHAIHTLPEPSLINENAARLSRYQLIQQQLQRFWTHWSSSYLQQQLALTKWHTPNHALKIGSLVLLTDERFPPSKWPLARILELHPGADGLTRVVTIKTATTTLTRPISKLAVLPCSE